MKTKIKTAALLVALLCSASGAFASQISKTIGSGNVATYSWQKFMPDGLTPMGDPVMGDDESPFAECCQGTEHVCAVGTPISPDEPVITIRFQE